MNHKILTLLTAALLTGCATVEQPTPEVFLPRVKLVVWKLLP